MANFTVRIEAADIRPDLVRLTQCDWITPKKGWISIYLNQGSVFMGDYDAECVTVARALAAQLTAAADTLDAMLTEQPADQPSAEKAVV